MYSYVTVHWVPEGSLLLQMDRSLKFEPALNETGYLTLTQLYTRECACTCLVFGIQIVCQNDRENKIRKTVFLPYKVYPEDEVGLRTYFLVVSVSVG